MREKAANRYPSKKGGNIFATSAATAGDAPNSAARCARRGNRQAMLTAAVTPAAAKE